MKTNPLQRTFRYLGIFPAIFSLGACGLPDGGERPHSTAMTGDDRRCGHQTGRTGATTRRGASGEVRTPLPSGRPRCTGGAAGAGGRGAMQPRCAVFHLEQGHVRQGLDRAPVPRRRPGCARAIAARRSRHDATSADQTETHLAPQLREVVGKTKNELFLVSPYFVPGKEGVELLSDVRKRGVRVVVITNSLASTDGIPVHSKYQHYRKPLIEAGIELYEIKPTAGAQLKRRFRQPAGSSTGGLHAKTFTFDRRIGFIGTYNLDPRSSKLNTEMGVLFDCPPLARRLPGQT